MLRRYWVIFMLSLGFMSQAYSATKLEDEGVNKGYINVLDVVGSNVAATRSGITGTLTMNDSPSYTLLTADTLTDGTLSITGGNIDSVGIITATSLVGTSLIIDSNIVNLADTTDEYVLGFDTATQTWRGIEVAGGGTDDQTLAEVLAEGADANDLDITSMAQLQGVDANTYIDMDTTDIITTKGNLVPSGNGVDDLGTDALEYNNAFFDGTMEADVITESGNAVFNTTEVATFVGLNSSGAINLDDGVGNSPSLSFIDADNNYFALIKYDAGAGGLFNNEGAIRLSPSNDADDYITVKTDTNISYIGRDDDDDLIKLEADTVTIAGTITATGLSGSNSGDDSGTDDQTLDEVLTAGATADTESITLTAGTLTAATLADGTLTITGGVITGATIEASGNTIDADTGDSATSFFDAGTIEGARLGTFSKSFVILAPIATDDYPVWKSPTAITVTAVHVQCLGGTNIVGQLTECNAEGISCAVCDSTDITATANNSEDDDGTLSNGSIDALDYVGWKTESISGTPTSVTVTWEYTK